jgi:hypothetical protein
MQKDFSSLIDQQASRTIGVMVTNKDTSFQPIEIYNKFLNSYNTIIKLSYDETVMLGQLLLEAAQSAGRPDKCDTCDFPGKIIREPEKD